VITVTADYIVYKAVMSVKRELRFRKLKGTLLYQNSYVMLN